MKTGSQNQPLKLLKYGVSLFIAASFLLSACNLQPSATTTTTPQTIPTVEATRVVEAAITSTPLPTDTPRPVVDPKEEFTTAMARQKELKTVHTALTEELDMGKMMSGMGSAGNDSSLKLNGKMTITVSLTTDLVSHDFDMTLHEELPGMGGQDAKGTPKFPTVMAIRKIGDKTWVQNIETSKWTACDNTKMPDFPVMTTTRTLNLPPTVAPVHTVAPGDNLPTAVPTSSYNDYGNGNGSFDSSTMLCQMGVLMSKSYQSMGTGTGLGICGCDDQYMNKLTDFTLVGQETVNDIKMDHLRANLKMNLGDTLGGKAPSTGAGLDLSKVNIDITYDMWIGVADNNLYKMVGKINMTGMDTLMGTATASQYTPHSINKPANGTSGKTTRVPTSVPVKTLRVPTSVPTKTPQPATSTPSLSATTPAGDNQSFYMVLTLEYSDFNKPLHLEVPVTDK